ncbi:MAG: 2-C-methyl-D-erythritol 4-phosphate cytidylyltransferase [Planctomycetota bacterium]
MILVGAGEGRRFGKPKAFVELGGRTLLERAAAAFEHLPHRVAVLRDEDRARAPLAGWAIVAGGARRRDSVAKGLAALDPAAEVVLIHDVARPLVPAEVVTRVAEAAARHPAVIPVVPVTDTIKRVDGDRVLETLPRDELAAVQTPQAFRRDLLERALAASADDATDEAGLVEALGTPIHTVPGSARNRKVTGPEDLRIAEALLQPE